MTNTHDLEERIHSLKIKNASLERKVEKMKRCANCCHFEPDRCPICVYIQNCENFKYWKLQE